MIKWSVDSLPFARKKSYVTIPSGGVNFLGCSAFVLVIFGTQLSAPRWTFLSPRCRAREVWSDIDKIQNDLVVGHIWSQFLPVTWPLHAFFRQTLSLPALAVPRWVTEAVLMLKRHGAAAEVQVEGSFHHFRGCKLEKKPGIMSHQGWKPYKFHWFKCTTPFTVTLRVSNCGGIGGTLDGFASKQLFLADKDPVGAGCIAGFYMSFPLGL